MDEPLTRSLDRYDVLDRIAVGGMAEVFLAKAYGAHGFEKTLAIKRILPDLARDPEFEARFIAEAKVAVRLSHANVVQVLDFGRIGESLFIAMEYVDGLDLAGMLRRFKDEGRQLPLPAAFHIAIEIIRALDFAHGHNVVHRDVSPSNVLVSRAGEVKLADFGIAVAAQPHRGGGPGPRKVMGKWRYMSPEQARGDTLDTRSDLFSAAVVIFELFTGQKLFPGEESEDIIKNIHDMPIPRMTSLRSGIPSRLDDVLATALARKPIDRPSRPAVVLRSLIELSYESSIMATALDVAEALATVIPAKRLSGRGALDDVIRKQLHEQSVARRTAVTDGQPTVDPPPAAALDRPGDVSTGLFRKVDVDGLSRLEVEATRVAGPRARRTSEQAAVLGDSGAHGALDRPDRDRFTEVGGPPTGQVPKVGASAANLPAAAPAPTARPAPRRAWLVVGLALVVTGGLAIYGLTRGGPAPVVAAPAEAGVVEVHARLTIDPDPEGARGWFEVAGDRTTRAPIPALSHATPFSSEVRPGTRYRIHLELAGHNPYDDSVIVSARESLRIKPKLAPAPARLDIATDPPGAEITLAGRVLGETPKQVDSLAPATGAVVTLQKPGYTTVTRTIDLVAGATTTIRETLHAVERFGYLTVEVHGAATLGEVWFNGRSLGMNATFTGGPRKFKLPVGPGTLKVSNRAAGKTATRQVTITEGAQAISVTL